MKAAAWRERVNSSRRGMSPARAGQSRGPRADHGRAPRYGYPGLTDLVGPHLTSEA